MGPRVTATPTWIRRSSRRKRHGSVPESRASTHPVLALQREVGNQAVGRLIQRYADCSPTRMSLAKCPPRQKGEPETAKNGAMVFVPELNMGSGGKGVLIANFDINSAAIKANLAQTIYWKQFLRGAGKNKKKWRIEGFSDCQGGEKGNQPLREKRAKAILSILPAPLRANITATEGASPGDCISENSTAAQRTFNRSVSLILEESTYDFKGETIEGKVERDEPKTAGCSDDQRKRLAIAFPLARRIGENAMAAISGMQRGSPEEALLKKFFGPDAFKERWHIKQGYHAALKALANRPDYKCVPDGTSPCSSGTSGYVGPHAVIFGSPTIVCHYGFYGDNIELADTILHEASHVGGWTRDIDYCMPSRGCTNLPTTDELVPGIGLSDVGAVNNADSYGRFASELFRR